MLILKNPSFSFLNLKSDVIPGHDSDLQIWKWKTSYNQAFHITIMNNNDTMNRFKNAIGI